jgi:OOP family OmpA-OmpF porin
MKKFTRLVLVSSIAAMASVAGAQEIYNWRNASGEVWKSVSGECWRSAAWSPATAAEGCDGAIAPKAAEPAPSVAPAPVVEAPPAPKAAPAAPVAEKVSYSAEALFAFDKSVLTPKAKAELDGLVAKLKNMELEVAIAVGHADSTGPEAYNQKLSVRRAEAVKAYLVSNGVEKNRIYTEGKGETQPAVDNNSKQNRAKNRRVVVEIVGKAAN